MTEPGVLVDATIWDLEFRSDFQPPFAFHAYGDGKYPNVADDDAVCAMEVVSIAMGADEVREDPPGVHPILATLARRINDGITDAKARTTALWPLLPKLFGTGFRYRNWEIDIYQMAVDRRLSNLEFSAILSGLTATEIASNLGEDLCEREWDMLQWQRFLDFAIRGYWSSAGTFPQSDWTVEQYERLLNPEGYAAAT